MTNLEKFRKIWVGRRFKCNKTGEVLTIPEDVRECQYFAFGECGVDVGRYPFYARWVGDLVELNKDD